MNRAMPFTWNNSKRRSGLTTIEVIVSTVLLGVAAVGVGKFAASINAGLKSRDLSMRLSWEIRNARETIGSWDIENVTQESIEQLEISPVLRERLQEVRWQAVVTEVQAPVPSKQVELRLLCRFEGQAANPKRLVFWVTDKSLFAEEPGVSATRNDSEKAEQASQHDTERPPSPRTTKVRSP